MEDTKLSILPDEVIVQILLRVPLSSFRAINSTCKYWQSILARREFWKYLSKLIWCEKSTPSSDFASDTAGTPVIPGEQLVDWKEYFRIRSKLDGIASSLNALQNNFTLNLDADLDTKMDVISDYLSDQMVPDVDEDAVEMLLKMILSCCDYTFSFSSLGVVWLERLPERYFGGLARHPELMRKIIKITDDILQHSTEENQQHVLEFWSSSCDQEIDYREGGESHLPTDNSSLFIGSCCKDLVPLLIRTISDEKYAPTEQDENSWNVRQAAETCLQQVTKVVLGDIVPLVEPILHRDLNSEDWKRRDIALEILGLMFTENHYDYIEKNAASFLLQVLESLKFNHVHVRQTAAWALSQICRSYAKEIKVHNALLSKAVLEALSDVSSVRQYIYACMAHYANLESENPFEKDFPRLIEALTASLATSQDNTLPIYESMVSLITVQEDLKTIKPLIRIVLQNMKQDSNAISVATAITRKCPEEVLPYVNQLMSVYLSQMLEEVTEEVLAAIGYTAAAMGEEGFARFLPGLMPLVLPLLNDAQNTGMFIGALGLISDLCISTKASIIPYCDQIMQSILTAVGNPLADRSIRPEIISLLGDIAIAIGGKAYERYLTYVMQVLKQAGEVIMEQHDEMFIELEEYIGELKRAWFYALTGLFQSYQKNKLASQLVEFIPTVLHAVITTVNSSVNSKIASVAIYLVGDIVRNMEAQNVKLDELRKRQDLNQCLMLALGSTEEYVVEAAQWVLSLLKE